MCHCRMTETGLFLFIFKGLCDPKDKYFKDNLIDMG